MTSAAGIFAHWSPATIVAIAGCFAAITHVYVMHRCRRRSDGASAHSRPVYHGTYAAVWVLWPVIAAIAIWSFASPRWIDQQLADQLQAVGIIGTGADPGLFVNEVRNVADGVIASADTRIGQMATTMRRLQSGSFAVLGCACLLLALGGLLRSLRLSTPEFPARVIVERYFRALLLLASSLAVLTTIGIVASVLFESARFFDTVPVSDFLFGTQWSPQTPIREGQAAGSGAFGAIPLFAGTLLITAIAMIVAVPLGLMTAVYLHEYASERFRSFAKPLLEVLAGIPTVIYGFFAALVVAPKLGLAGQWIGLPVAPESALAAGLVVGIMIIPLISSLSDDAFSAVPATLKQGSLALGATRSESICRVLLPAALPGVAGGVLLALSRAIGETMIVVMAAGLAANLTVNPLEAVTTVTVQMVNLLVGDQEFDSAKTLAAFALGLLLFVVTLLLNASGLRFVRHYREQYE